VGADWEESVQAASPTFVLKEHVQEFRDGWSLAELRSMLVPSPISSCSLAARLKQISEKGCFRI